MTTDTKEVIKKEVPISDEEHFLQVIAKIYQENEMLSNSVENQYDFYNDMREQLIFADYSYEERRVENPIKFFNDMQEFVDEIYLEDYDAERYKDEMKRLIDEYKSSDVYARLNPIVPDEVKTQIKEFCQTIEQLQECITMRVNELQTKEDEIRQSQLVEIVDERAVLSKITCNLPENRFFHKLNAELSNEMQQVDLVKLIKSIVDLTSDSYDLDNSTEEEFVSLINMTDDFVNSDYYKSITEK